MSPWLSGTKQFFSSFSERPSKENEGSIQLKNLTSKPIISQNNTSYLETSLLGVNIVEFLKIENNSDKLLLVFCLFVC